MLHYMKESLLCNLEFHNNSVKEINQRIMYFSVTLFGGLLRKVQLFNPLLMSLEKQTCSLLVL